MERAQVEPVDSEAMWGSPRAEVRQKNKGELRRHEAC